MNGRPSLRKEDVDANGFFIVANVWLVASIVFLILQEHLWEIVAFVLGALFTILCIRSWSSARRMERLSE